MSQKASPEQVLITADGLGLTTALREVVRYRELVWFFVWRQIKIRYKQTAIGASWAIIQPVLTMLVFTLFFGKLARLPSDGISYPVFFLGGLVPWTYFSNSTNAATNVLVDNGRIITRVYFPRMALPIAAVLSGLLDMAVATAFLLVLAAATGVGIGPHLVLLPLLALLTGLCAYGIGAFTSALNAKYRDIKYAIPVLLQVWLFTSPIAYSSSLVPERWRALYSLNPLVGIIEGYRWAATGGATPAPSGTSIAMSIVVAFALAVLGTIWFLRAEDEIVDVV